MAIEKVCRQCGEKFYFTDDDKSFLERVSPLVESRKYLFSEPDLCPHDRERMRQLWRNERHLFRRECALCHKFLISIYAKESFFPVYCEQCFWGDKWDPCDYGKEFDFSRSFFEQFSDLLKAVPHIAVTHTKCVNSDYALNCIEDKNCYLTSGADYNENLMYGINSQRSKTCVDHYWVNESELCYGCLDSFRIYNCVGCQDCAMCSDCWFLYDSKGCKNCAFSSDLKNREFVLFNEQLSEADYFQKFEQIKGKIFSDPDWVDVNRRLVREKAVHRYALLINCENCSGHIVRDSKNSHYVFDSENLEDCRYIYYGLSMKDSQHCSCIGFACELDYEVMSACNNYHSAFCSSSFYNNNSYYLVSCFNSDNCFGSVSLRNHKKFVLLNKQYSQAEYFQVLTKVIEHMQKTGEWGRFFPGSLAPFEFNRSMAFDREVLSREEALRRGFRWFDGVEEHPSSGDARVCLNCKREFRLIAQELEFYKKMNVTKPAFCWSCRLKKLINSRRPMKLYDNECSKCGLEVKSTYTSDHPEKIFCERCYLEMVY